ncbi:nuclear transport factor 2 family protein [Arenibacter aquaticus]|uniref:Nuclear transport factor 2 family protein n=1 Tax=Arenibacter aquaticus TaxID=2489054 RepID=A0A430JZ31_9FLAO|nr:nuclear transport factor 2 family protein [Arenibacter aquaticus]RTE52063.1 nuclear transport factor 2 family protein [Arenibacter aquaticus]
MKRTLILTLMLSTVIGLSQKKKNGTIYLEHPAIETVNAMTTAFVAGDVEKVSTYLADDFMSYNGFSTDKDDKGRNKEQYLESVKFWKDNISYLQIEPTKGAYPDALEYKKSGIWVQTWDHLKGMHNKSGVKLDMPYHTLYKLNEDNKIKTLINYYDNNVIWEVRRSFNDRQNGIIYNHHDNINTVRVMMHAFEFNDLDTYYSFFDENAVFYSLELPDGESMDLEQAKERNNQILETYNIDSVDEQGYPDYLEYDMQDAKVVQSWWKFRITRKSDGKKFILPAMYTHDFNDEGKVIRTIAYVSTKILDSK